MPAFIEETPEAAAWVARVRVGSAAEEAFGKIAESVVWSDATGPDGQLLVPLDPNNLVEKISSDSFPILMRHDPGFPLGKIIDAAVFTHPSGRVFVAAILGLYAGKQLSFRDFGFDEKLSAPSPTSLPPLPAGLWINIVTDPREIDQSWVDQLTELAPLPVKYVKASHNALEAPHELIRIGILFMALVWNPFATAIASEAGKATYAAIRDWMRRLFEKLGERKNPVLEIQAFHAGCQISFFVRGNDVARHYKAHEALPAAAAQAERLVATLGEAGLAPRVVAYEFDREADRWVPSFAELGDGRLVTDNPTLIAIEQLPQGLSLGLQLGDERPHLPSVRRSD